MLLQVFNELYYRGKQDKDVIQKSTGEGQVMSKEQTRSKHEEQNKIETRETINVQTA